MNKTIICVPRASLQDLDDIKESLENNPQDKLFLINKDVKVFVIKDKQLFEVVSDLKEVKGFKVSKDV
jgi:hypothetical protein